jgi:hypothetical protein
VLKGISKNTTDLSPKEKRKGVEAIKSKVFRDALKGYFLAFRNMELY